MKTTLNVISIPLLTSLFGLLMSSSLSAGNYYQWVGEDGITHYGSLPPAGVEAKEMRSSGSHSQPAKIDAPSPQEGTKAKAPDEPGLSAERKKELEMEQRKQCQSERERLKTLTKKGTKIRMKDDDGSIRYLNANDLAKEVASSEQFIKEACK